MTFEQEVLERVRPSEQVTAAVDKAARSLKSAVDAYIAEHGITAETTFVGSYAKKTFLDGNDLDLFVMFPKTMPKEDIVDIGLRIGDDVLHGTHAYAEHPYSSGKWEGTDVDLVPCYRIEPGDRPITAVDRSPLHTNYVISKMAEQQRDEVRLLKRFMKGIGAYGAEPENRGFSGYLCELLVLKYGTFDGVLEAA